LGVGGASANSLPALCAERPPPLTPKSELRSSRPTAARREGSRERELAAGPRSNLFCEMTARQSPRSIDLNPRPDRICRCVPSRWMGSRTDRMDGLHFFMVRSAASKRLVNGAAPRRPPKDAPMRISALAIATILATAPARAQTYNPDYPVCLQVYGIGGGYIACGYTSLAQCAQSASGRAAQCIINPYFANAHGPAGPHHRRHRRSY
jgi:hypothetical protein